MTDLAENHYNDIKAESEGWFISACSGVTTGENWQIQRRDENPIFTNDEEAHIFVVTRANEGSENHRAALAFIKENEPLEYNTITKTCPTTYQI